MASNSSLYLSCLLNAGLPANLAIITGLSASTVKPDGSVLSSAGSSSASNSIGGKADSSSTSQTAGRPAAVIAGAVVGSVLALLLAAAAAIRWCVLPARKAARNKVGDSSWEGNNESIPGDRDSEAQENVRDRLMAGATAAALPPPSSGLPKSAWRPSMPKWLWKSRNKVDDEGCPTHRSEERPEGDKVTDGEDDEIWQHNAAGATAGAPQAMAPRRPAMVHGDDDDIDVEEAVASRHSAGNSSPFFRARPRSRAAWDEEEEIPSEPGCRSTGESAPPLQGPSGIDQRIPVNASIASSVRDEYEKAELGQAGTPSGAAAAVRMALAAAAGHGISVEGGASSRALRSSADSQLKPETRPILPSESAVLQSGDAATEGGGGAGRLEEQPPPPPADRPAQMRPLMALNRT